MTRELLAGFGAVALAAAFATPVLACPAHTADTMSTPVKTAQISTPTETTPSPTAQE